MTTILRSPVISTETRKLSSRHASAAQAAPAAHSQPQPAAVPNIEALLAQARESVLAQFKQEAETACELGRQRGLQEGRVAGAEEVRREADAELARIRSIASGLQGALAAGIHGVEDVAVAIAFEAVCKMLGSAAVSRDGIRVHYVRIGYTVSNGQAAPVALHLDIDIAAVTDAPTLRLLGDTVKRQVFSTGWESAPNVGSQSTLVDAGVFEGWSLVTGTDMHGVGQDLGGGKDGFEIWSGRDLAEQCQCRVWFR
jgi:hypothetical protein